VRKQNAVFVKYVSVPTVLAAETHLAEGLALNYDEQKE
jgi:hypothetical protein